MDGGQYEGLVIVAHSQGTVITADLLKFLKRHPQRRLDRFHQMPVYFITVGSPLRQIYTVRFPHLYRWAGHTDRYSMNEPQPQDIPADKKPDPAELGVTRWINAFRSGDYIGRWLWRSDTCVYQSLRPAPKLPEDRRPWNPRYDDPVNVSEDAACRRREFCLGSGGHWRYFDETAKRVAVEIDRAIVEVCLPAIQQPASRPSTGRS